MCLGLIITFFVGSTQLKGIAIAHNGKAGLGQVKVFYRFSFYTVSPLCKDLRSLPFVSEGIHNNILTVHMLVLTPYVKGLDNKGISMGDFHIVAWPIEGEKDSADLPLDEGTRVSNFFWTRGANNDLRRNNWRKCQGYCFDCGSRYAEDGWRWRKSG